MCVQSDSSKVVVVKYKMNLLIYRIDDDDRLLTGTDDAIVEGFGEDDAAQNISEKKCKIIRSRKVKLILRPLYTANYQDQFAGNFAGNFRYQECTSNKNINSVIIDKRIRSNLLTALRMSAVSSITTGVLPAPTPIAG